MDNPTPAYQPRHAKPPKHRLKKAVMAIVLPLALAFG
jgi:hypothetical protein